MEQTQIKGYDYGKTTLEQSPVSMHELDLLKQTLLWNDETGHNLKKAGEVLKDQVDEVLDLWYNYVASNEHLLYYFSKNGEPVKEYLEAVRPRFGQWILDLCNRPLDQEWLDYQYEIAKRHHITKKNKTDGVDAAPIIHFRYLVAFIYPITATIKGFLAKKVNDQAELDAIYDAWFKAVTLTALLWCYPYVNKGEF